MATASRFPPEHEPVSRTGWSRVAGWLAAVAVLTALLWAGRTTLDKSHLALAYLLLVLLGSARGGRVAALAMSVASFFAFNFFLLPPYYTLRLFNPLDWWVLIAYLVVAFVSSELVARQRQATVAAQRRAAEVERLGALGAESLTSAGADAALHAIAEVLQAELPVTAASVEPAPGTVDTAAASELLTFVVERGRIAGVALDGTSMVEPADVALPRALLSAAPLRELLVPLRVRNTVVGVLRLCDDEGLRFTPAQAAYADALSYYAALALERLRLEREAEHVAALREADRLKDELLASVSHDLRTPLTSIRAAAAELRGAGEERGALIEEEAERLNRMVADLLDLSRARAGALPIRLEINAVDDLLGAALRQVSALPGADAVAVRLEDDGAPLLGRFDFVQSLRVLSNLLDNALRHSPDPGSVRLTARREGQDIAIRVEDRGVGVPERDRERLFQPYFRSASAAGTQGTGLGLAIARSVAEAQGGAVSYEPRAGGGSVFEFRLPAADLPATRVDERDTTPGPRPGSLMEP